MAVKATQQTDTDIATPENAEAASGADAAQQAIKTLMRLGKEGRSRRSHGDGHRVSEGGRSACLCPVAVR